MLRLVNALDVARNFLLSTKFLLRLAAAGFAALLLSQFVLAAVGGGRARAAEPVKSVRIWPAQDYTRVTFESKNLLRYEMLSVKNPERLVLDLEDVEFASVLQQLGAQAGAQLSEKPLQGDPYIASVRAARYKPGVVRVVFDLKSEVKPQLFVLKPVGEYGHRLVLDLYPLVPADPLMALLESPADGDKPSDAATALPEIPAAAVAKDIPAPAATPAPPPAPIAAEDSRGKPSGKAPSTARPLVDRLVTIVLDAGHGGEDPGALGRGGAREKHVTLAIAKRLKAAIDAEPNMRAVLTRDRDFFIPLAGRVEKARRVRADLFVSIHADSFVKPHARGSSVFALSERGATSTAARLLAKKENDADLIGGVNLAVKDRYLAQTLLDLSQTATIQDSLKLGRSVLAELGDINDLHKAEVEQAGFAVLKAPDIPSILVETAFISNPEEEKRLTDDGYQDKMAQAILKGIKRYFSRNPPLSRATLASK